MMNGRGRSNRRYGFMAAALLAVIVGMTVSWKAVSTSGEEGKASSCAAGEGTVLLGGMPVGIYMETDGVMVLGTQKLESVEKVESEPAKGAVKSGDYITAVNHRELEGKKQLQEMIQAGGGREAVLTVRRGDSTFDVKVDPVECAPDDYKLGIWVRDNVQGLGTVTFLTGDGHFGALGHGIHDVDTSGLMDISGGALYKTSIQNVKKGSDGNPGTMEGIIVYSSFNRIGTVEQNTEAGIYGTVENVGALFEEQIPVRTAGKDEIVKGDAVVRCFVDGKVQEYDIKITGIDKNCREINKGIVIEVTDQELLEKTGGIIQGMSGSPIIQNGRLVGAVTHVFVQDSTAGYGIFIENMLRQAK